jgi:hypothetical protein
MHMRAPDCLYGPGITDLSAICTRWFELLRAIRRYQSEEHRVAEAGHRRPEKRVRGDRKFRSSCRRRFSRWLAWHSSPQKSSFADE